MAVVLAKRGETTLAEEYIKSLDEYTVETEEMGRYYDSPRTGYSWFDYGIPTQVAAIEAMTLVDAQGYSASIDGMKRWLLMQKRVQDGTRPTIMSTPSTRSLTATWRHLKARRKRRLPSTANSSKRRRLRLDLATSRWRKNTKAVRR